LHSIQECFLCHTIQVADDSVVRKDSQLLVWENHSKKEVVLLISCMAVALLFQFSARATGTSSTMVTICDIQQWNTTKRVDITYGIRHMPHCVTNTIRRSKVIQRRPYHGLHHHGINFTSGAICEEHRTRLRL